MLPVTLPILGISALRPITLPSVVRGAAAWNDLLQESFLITLLCAIRGKKVARVDSRQKGTEAIAD